LNNFCSHQEDHENCKIQLLVVVTFLKLKPNRKSDNDAVLVCEIELVSDRDGLRNANCKTI